MLVVLIIVQIQAVILLVVIAELFPYKELQWCR
jgi:hypothetical protein